MPHTTHYSLADNFIVHMSSIIPTLSDPFIVSRYAGFTSIAATTVYELAIKSIFIEFASKKHKVFGNYARGHYLRVNGRIKLEEIQHEHLKKFGSKYLDRFKRKLENAELSALKCGNGSIKSAYSNIVTWRHAFAHEGIIPTTVTPVEVAYAYTLGKGVIQCLAETMQR